jgi:hypothetical protein
MIKSIVTWVLFAMVFTAMAVKSEVVPVAALLATAVTVAADFITAVIEGYRNA